MQWTQLQIRFRGVDIRLCRSVTWVMIHHWVSSIHFLQDSWLWAICSYGTQTPISQISAEMRTETSEDCSKKKSKTQRSTAPVSTANTPSSSKWKCLASMPFFAQSSSQSLTKPIPWIMGTILKEKMTTRRSSGRSSTRIWMSLSPVQTHLHNPKNQNSCHFAVSV